MYYVANVMKTCFVLIDRFHKPTSHISYSLPRAFLNLCARAIIVLSPTISEPTGAPSPWIGSGLEQGHF